VRAFSRASGIEFVFFDRYHMPEGVTQDNVPALPFEPAAPSPRAPLALARRAAQIDARCAAKAA
jgi:hypothetical protein